MQTTQTKLQAHELPKEVLLFLLVLLVRLQLLRLLVRVLLFRLVVFQRQRQRQLHRLVVVQRRRPFRLHGFQRRRHLQSEQRRGSQLRRERGLLIKKEYLLKSSFETRKVKMISMPKRIKKCMLCIRIETILRRIN